MSLAWLGSTVIANQPTQACQTLNKYFTKPRPLCQTDSVPCRCPCNSHAPTFVVGEHSRPAGGDEECERAGDDDEVCLGGLRLIGLEHLRTDTNMKSAICLDLWPPLFRIRDHGKYHYKRPMPTWACTS